MLWGGSLFVIWFVLPVVFFWIAPILPFIMFSATLIGIYFIGIKSAKKLLETVEKEYGKQIRIAEPAINNPAYPSSLALSPVRQPTSLQLCPKCNEPMEPKISPKGRKFLVCPNYQECKQAMSID
jgi:hypothetical protein